MIPHWVEGSPRASPQPPRSVMMTTHSVSRVTHIFSLKPHHASRKKKHSLHSMEQETEGRRDSVLCLKQVSGWMAEPALNK